MVLLLAALFDGVAKNVVFVVLGYLGIRCAMLSVDLGL